MQDKIDDIILIDDLNQSVYSKEIEEFLITNSLFNVYDITNETSNEKKDSTYRYGSKCIDIIAATPELIIYIDRCQMTDFEEVIITDYRGYLVDL